MWPLGEVAVDDDDDDDDDDVFRLAESAQCPVHTIVFTPPDWPRMTEGTRWFTFTYRFQIKYHLKKKIYINKYIYTKYRYDVIYVKMMVMGDEAGGKKGKIERDEVLDLRVIR